MEILNSSERESLKQLRSDILSLKDNFKFQALGVPQQKTLQAALESLSIALDSFDSGMFIVTTIGMLKAGKSTLVNLFARDKLASPTGFGFDTTLRPALITQTDDAKGCIEIWTCRDSEKSMSKEILGEVFSCLRGVKTPKQVTNAACQVYNLTPATLENALCKKPLEAEDNILPSEPIMVVVKVPKHDHSLLSSEITIMDTPGLDSGLSVWTDSKGVGSEQYSWLINNSDLLLFLQSSVAPLNQKATNILKDIHAKQQNIPIWLIQNEMEAKHWLTPEKLKSENSRQRAKAAEAFNKVIKVFSSLSANLGKADTAVFDDSYTGPKEQLLQESQLQSMEEKIKSSLQQNIGPIRRKNCISLALRESQALAGSIGEIKTQTDLEIKELQKNAEALMAFRRSMEKDLYDPPVPKLQYPLIDSVADIQFRTTNPFCDKHQFIHMLNEQEREKFAQEQYSADELKNIIQEIKVKLLEQIKESISKTRIDDFCLFIQSKGIAVNNIPDHILEKFKNFVLGIYKNQDFPEQISKAKLESIIQGVLPMIELPRFSDWLNLDVAQLDDISITISRKENFWNSIFELKKRNVEEAKLELLPYYNSADSSQGRFVKLLDSAAKTLKEQLLKWMNEIAFEQMQKQFVDLFNTEVEKQKASVFNKVSFLKKDSETLDMLLRINENCKKQIQQL